MMDYTCFTVFYEGPFWVGIFEKSDIDGYCVARVVFGPEPTDAQILEYLFQHYPNEVSYSHVSSEEAPVKKLKQVNPKRSQREAKALLAKQGTGTKAQQAVKIAYEERREAHKKQLRLAKELRADERYQKKTEKKKQKKRGR